MEKITLINDWHGTKVNVIPQKITEGRYKGYHSISRKTAQRLHDQLCGSDTCTCGDIFGSRGIQPGDTYISIVNEDAGCNYIVELIKK